MVGLRPPLTAEARQGTDAPAGWSPEELGVIVKEEMTDRFFLSITITTWDPSAC